ncbi:hypothetical protein TYRP_010357 [Tyrophagus putrescentiae]|nr:hypothetical protein TYRP_010357 [Tyrophagus putrescentiae]
MTTTSPSATFLLVAVLAACHLPPLTAWQLNGTDDKEFVLASGEGGQMRASLNLTADAQVVNYQHRFGNLSLPEETIKELSYQMSVFFVRGSSSASEHLLFPYDAFAFFVRIKPNPPFLLFSSLEDLEESLVRKENVTEFLP